MKYLLVFVAVAIIIASSNSEETYKSKFDNIDTEAIMKNERLLQNHFSCLIEGKGCTPEAEELKSHIPEIMETCCAKCSDKQKEETKKMTKFLIDKKPEIVTKLLDKYDPDRTYTKKCADNLKEAGIDLSSF